MLRFAFVLLGACYASPPASSPAKLAPPPPAATQQPHGTVIGRVTLDGQPVPYFGIAVADLGSDAPRAKAVQRADGTFAVDTVWDGGHDIIVAGPGFARRRLRDIDIPYGRVTDLGTIAVERGYTIEGVITDDTGAPVRDAIVRIDDLERTSADTEDILSRFARGASLEIADAHGHYRIEGIEPPDYTRNFFRLWARSADRNLASWPIKFPDRATTLDLVVAPTGSVQATVTAPEDHSFWGDNVWIHPAGNPRAGMLLRTSEAGRRIDNVPAGNYYVAFMTSGTAAQPAGQTITVTPSTTTTISFTVP